MAENDKKTENNNTGKKGGDSKSGKKNMSVASKYERRPNETSYDAKKRIKAEREALQKRNRRIATGSVIGVAAAAVAVILGINAAKNAQAADYFRINDEKISESEYHYYFNSAYNSMAELYSSYMGLDTSQPLDSQMYDDTQTYQDFFDKQTVDNIIYNHALIKDAKENDFSYDSSAEVNRQMDSLAEQLKENGSDLDLGSYFSQYFGVSEKDARKYIGDSIFAGEYYDSLADRIGATEEDVNKEYEADPDEYDEVEYYSVTVSADAGTEDGADTDAQKLDAAYQEALQKANSIAAASGLDEFKALAVSNGLYAGVEEIEPLTASGKSSVSDGEWLYGDRSEGDITVVEQQDYNSATVYYFVSRTKPVDITKNLYVYTVSASYEEGADETAVAEAVETAKADADALLAAFNETEKTADDFKALDHNGLSVSEYENTDEDSLPTILSDWAFTEERKEGDTGIIEGTEMYYVVYFAGDGYESWYAKVKSSLDSDKISEYVKNLTDSYEVSDPKGNLAYLRPDEEAEGISGLSGSGDGSLSTSVSSESDTDTSESSGSAE